MACRHFQEGVAGELLFRHDSSGFLALLRHRHSEFSFSQVIHSTRVRSFGEAQAFSSSK